MSRWNIRTRVAFRLGYSADVRQRIAQFDMPFERRFSLVVGVLIQDPFPRVGDGFEIVVESNPFGDRFLVLVADELHFAVAYDVLPWIQGERNPFEYEGRVHIFAFTPYASSGD